MTDRRHQRRAERAVQIQAQVDQLIRLDRAEDQLLDKAAVEAHDAEVHAGRALEMIAAAKRVDAMEDQVIAELRVETHDVAGDITAMTHELVEAARIRLIPEAATEATS